MKKLIAVLLVIVLACSLCACGSSAPPEPSIADQMYEKYGSIIDKLEAENYEAAIEEITGMMPEPEETVVTITPENFYDYYELSYIERKPKMDAAGNITEMYGDQLFNFKLKEDFADLIVPDESQVEVGITFDQSLKRIESIDWENAKLTFSKETYNDILQKINENVSPKIEPSFSGTYSGKNMLSPGSYPSFLDIAFYYYTGDFTAWRASPIEVDKDYTYYMLVPENIEIVRAEGTLTLRG